MVLTFTRSAARHGISQERAGYVVRHCPLPLHRLDDAGFQEIVFFLGLDANGVPMEVAAIDLGTDELLIIHAMPLRRKLREDFEWVMRAHER